MSRSLRALLFENPFTVIGAQLGATSKELRRLSDEMEMRHRLGGSGEKVVAIRGACQELDDPARRLEAEFLHVWEGSEIYGAAWIAHDRWLEMLKATMDGHGAMDSGRFESVLQTTASLVETDVAAAAGARAASLGVVNGDAAARRILGAIVLRGVFLAAGPVLTKRAQTAASAAAALAPDSIEATGHLVSEMTTRIPDLDANLPTATALVATLPRLFAVVATLRAPFPDLAAEFEDASFRFGQQAAVRRHNQDRPSEAEAILQCIWGQALSPDLRAMVADDLRHVRYTIRWKEANTAIAAGDLDAASVALQAALSTAPTTERRQETARAIQQVAFAAERKRKQTSPAGVAARWAKGLGGSVAVIAVIVGIGALVGSLGEDEDSAGPSTSGKSSYGTPVVSQTRAFLNEVDSELDDYLSASTAVDSTGIDTYPAARKSSPFQSSAQEAATAASALRRAASLSSHRGTCRDAMLRWAEVSESYWYDLAAGARTGNVTAWNRAIDTQDELNRVADAAATAC